jgi:hypothetical protein
MMRGYLLAIAWRSILALSAMNEGGGFGVKAMQTIGLLVDISVILRDKLPSNFGRNGVLMTLRRRRGCGSASHYGGMMLVTCPKVSF